MTSYLDDLVVRPVRGSRDVWETVAPFTFEHDGVCVYVPTGFEFDFASIPRWAWPVVGHPAQYAEAAALHDLLYARSEVDRQWADHIFYEALRESGVGKVKAWILWAAVRAFGGLARR